jgi:hypothetical protein
MSTCSNLMPQERRPSNWLIAAVSDRGKTPCGRYTNMNRYSSRAWSKTYFAVSTAFFHRNVTEDINSWSSFHERQGSDSRVMEFVDFDHDLQNNNRKNAGSVSDAMKPRKDVGVVVAYLG